MKLVPRLGPLATSEGVVEGHGRGGCDEADGEQVAVAGAGAADAVVQRLRRAAARVEDGVDGRVSAEAVGDALGVAAGGGDARGKVGAVAHHDGGVGGEVGVRVAGSEGGTKVRAERRRPEPEHGAAAHNVAGAAEHLGQAGADDVAEGQQAQVGGRADGVVDDDEAVAERQRAEPLHVDGAQQRVSRELGVEGVEPGGRRVAVEDAVEAVDLTEHLERVDVGEAKDGDAVAAPPPASPPRPRKASADMPE